MATSEVSLQEMDEVVIVTIPDAVTEDLSSVMEDKAVLVTSELTPQPGFVVKNTHCAQRKSWVVGTLCHWLM